MLALPVCTVTHISRSGRQTGARHSSREETRSDKRNKLIHARVRKAARPQGGYHQPKGKPLTLKQLFLLGVGSIATVQRRLRRLSSHRRKPGRHILAGLHHRRQGEQVVVSEGYDSSEAQFALLKRAAQEAKRAGRALCLAANMTWTLSRNLRIDAVLEAVKRHRDHSRHPIVLG